MFGLTYRNREILYDKINKRVDKMMDLGLADEAKKILSSKCSKTAMNAICYKEFIPYFRNQCSLNEVVEVIAHKYSSKIVHIKWPKISESVDGGSTILKSHKLDLLFPINYRKIEEIEF